MRILSRKEPFDGQPEFPYTVWSKAFEDLVPGSKYAKNYQNDFSYRLTVDIGGGIVIELHFPKVGREWDKISEDKKASYIQGVEPTWQVRLTTPKGSFVYPDDIGKSPEKVSLDNVSKLVKFAKELAKSKGMKITSQADQSSLFEDLIRRGYSAEEAKKIVDSAPIKDESAIQARMKAILSDVTDEDINELTLEVNSDGVSIDDGEGEFKSFDDFNSEEGNKSESNDLKTFEGNKELSTAEVKEALVAIETIVKSLLQAQGLDASDELDYSEVLDVVDSVTDTDEEVDFESEIPKEDSEDDSEVFSSVDIHIVSDGDESTVSISQTDDSNVVTGIDDLSFDDDMPFDVGEIPEEGSSDSLESGGSGDSGESDPPSLTSSLIVTRGFIKSGSFKDDSVVSRRCKLNMSWRNKSIGRKMAFNSAVGLFKESSKGIELKSASSWAAVGILASSLYKKVYSAMDSGDWVTFNVSKVAVKRVLSTMKRLGCFMTSSKNADRGTFGRRGSRNGVRGKGLGNVSDSFASDIENAKKDGDYAVKNRALEEVKSVTNSLHIQAGVERDIFKSADNPKLVSSGVMFDNGLCVRYTGGDVFDFIRNGRVIGVCPVEGVASNIGEAFKVLGVVSR